MADSEITGTPNEASEVAGTELDPELAEEMSTESTGSGSAETEEAGEEPLGATSEESTDPDIIEAMWLAEEADQIAVEPEPEGDLGDVAPDDESGIDEDPGE